MCIGPWLQEESRGATAAGEPRVQRRERTQCWERSWKHLRLPRVRLHPALKATSGATAATLARACLVQASTPCSANLDPALICPDMSSADAPPSSASLQAHAASCTDALLLSSSIIPPLATSLSGSAAWHPHRSESPPPFPHPSLLRQAASPGHTSPPWTLRMIWMIRDRCVRAPVL